LVALPALLLLPAAAEAAPPHTHTSCLAPPLVSCAGTLRLPLASWLLSEALIRWAGAWSGAEVDAAVAAVERGIIAAAASGGLELQVRWN
jgi:hypothetical protein